MRRLGMVLALGLTMGVLTAPAPALATNPGTDGRIAFDSDRYGATHNIFTMNPDGSDVIQLTFITADQGAALDQSWSPDGSELVYEQRNDGGSVRQIFEMNADGTNQHQMFSDPAHLDFYPSFSPDGTRVIFERCRQDGEACAIYSVRSDGHGLKAVTHFDVRHSIYDVRPEYSPDGQSVAFIGFNRGGVQAAVYVMNLDGSAMRMVTPARLEAGTFDWAPDGSTITFGSNCCIQRPRAIWTVGLDGSGLKRLTSPGSRNDVMSKFSPQGDRIVFERDSADYSRSAILTMNPDGSDVRRIQADAFVPSWGSAG